MTRDEAERRRWDFLGSLLGDKALYKGHFKDLVMLDRAVAEIPIFSKELAVV